MSGVADFAVGEIQARAAMLTPPPKVKTGTERSRRSNRDDDQTQRVDTTLEDSFPASDPPSWTASVARPAPAGKVDAQPAAAGPIRRRLQRAAALF